MAESLTYLCPFCNREVRVGTPCPGCEKKRKPSVRTARKSWEEDKVADGLDLPDDDFDYDDFVAREFGSKPHRQLGVKWYWWLLGVVLLVLLALGATGGISFLSGAEPTPPAMSQHAGLIPVAKNP